MEEVEEGKTVPGTQGKSNSDYFRISLQINMAASWRIHVCLAVVGEGLIP